MRMVQGKIAVVTGASRGAGRGIALELGAAGATVYVTGRSRRGGPTTMNRPETIDDLADAITAMGGVGIPVQVDHTDDAQVEALFQRVRAEQGRLDLLVNNVWGGNEEEIGSKPFWEEEMSNWERMFVAGMRAHVAASRYAVPLMLEQGRGLIINTSFYDRGRYTGTFWYDLAKNGICRAAFGMAQQLRPHGIAAVAVSPGFMRTELVLAHFGATEETWRSFPDLARTETPRYVGRAVVALAADPQIMAKTGQSLRAGDLAQEYGFTDVDGRYVPPFEI